MPSSAFARLPADTLVDDHDGIRSHHREAGALRMHDARLGPRHADDVVRGGFAGQHGFVDVRDGQNVGHAELREQLAASRRRRGQAEERRTGEGAGISRDDTGDWPGCSARGRAARHSSTRASACGKVNRDSDEGEGTARPYLGREPIGAADEEHQVLTLLHAAAEPSGELARGELAAALIERDDMIGRDECGQQPLAFAGDRLRCASPRGAQQARSR